MKLTLLLKLTHLLNSQNTSKGPLSNSRNISIFDLFLTAKACYSFHQGGTYYIKSHYFPISTCF